MDSLKIAIVGAGVVGLTVGSMLQAQLRDARITIFAEKRTNDTTSAVAAGIFRPGTSFKGPNPQITKQWIDDSWNYWQDILTSPEASSAGVMPIDSYILSKQNYHITRNHLIEDLVPVYRQVNDGELKTIGEVWKYGSFFSTQLVSCERHLPWAEGKFLKNGGQIVNKKIESLQSLKGFDLVINCSGMGAKYLCEDHDLVPIRGQIIKVKAPWLKSAFYGDYDAYIIPGYDGLVTLGGTRQYDSYNLDVCKYDAAGILDRCCEVVPELRQAEVVAHKVGLRPHRVPVRVEGEVLGGIKVVHCYGHGGYGVTCAPGTAKHAVEIGLNMLLKHKL